MNNIKKIKRTAHLISVLTKYGFETLVVQTGIRNFIPDSYVEKNEKRKSSFSLSIYERIRLALEELGPAYIKLGQLMSNRDDLLPSDLTLELQKLQDNVTVTPIDVYATLREELSIEPEEVFELIDQEPIAAASLSQVYTGILKNTGQKVIIKIKKKGMLEVVEADILIMKDFSRLLENYYEAAQSIGLVQIVNTFEKAILSELSFTQELGNIERFRRNFKGSEVIYVPETCKDISNNNILCMEFIDGIKVSDKDKIIEAGLDTAVTASKIVDSYLKQIIEDGFFHADPHAGNIFALSDGKISFIDYGSMGRMIPQDKEDLANFIMYALKKDAKQLIRIIKKIAIKSKITNELQFERDLYDFLEIIDNNSIKELDLKMLLGRFSSLLNENKIILPDYVYLLARGVVLLEGIGRELGLEINIMDSVRPYASTMFKQRLNPAYVSKKIFNKLYNWGDKFEDLPDDIHQLIQKVNHDEIKMTHSITGLKDIKTTINRLVLAILVCSLVVGASLLILAEMPPVVWGISFFGLTGLMLATAMAILIIISILRNKSER